MRHVFATAAAFVCFASSFAGQTREDDLYNSRRWFELRNAATSQSSRLMRASLAVAFNDPGRAERELLALIRSEQKTPAANDAYRMLSQLYLRSGRYRRLIDNFDQWTKAFGDNDDVREARQDFEQFRGLPNQSSSSGRASAQRHDGDFSARVTVNGQPATYLLDTGAWLSLITNREARRLGLVVREGTGKLGDASGKGVTFRTAIAKEVVLGEMRFRDVSFGVIENDAEGGILGMPVLLGIGRVRWLKDGSIEFGGRATTQNVSESNLVFDRHKLLLQVQVDGKDVLTTFDTGAVGTDLNANFAATFQGMVERLGLKGVQNIEGLGGKQDFETITMPEVFFSISGVAVGLRPAHITMQRNPAMGGECCVGNLGRDLLTQGTGFTIDLAAMTLRLQ